MAKRKIDHRSKKFHREQKQDLVKRGLCRQCGARRDKRSPSTVRCSRCHRKHVLQNRQYYRQQVEAVGDAVGDAVAQAVEAVRQAEGQGKG